MKNVLYFESSSGYGGSGNALVQILKHLNKAKYNPLVVVCQDGPQFDRIRQMGIEVIRCPFQKLEEKDARSKWVSYLKFIFDFTFKVIPLAFRLRHLIKDRNISVVHVNTNILSGLPALIACKLAGIPCICHMRITKRFISREKFFAPLVTRFILLNHEALKLYQRYVPRERLEVVYDGIDLDSYSKNKRGASDFRKEFKINGQKSVGVIGRLVEGKGQDDFIKAASLLAKKEKGIKFLLIGDDPSEKKDYLKKLQRMVKRLKIGSKVIFTGWRNDLTNVMQGLDIVVHPTSTFPEGLPNTLIEALYLNKPTVATNIPGSSEIIFDHKTGILVEPKQPEQIADAIKYLVDHPRKAGILSKHGQKYAQESFDMSKNIKQIEAIYEEVIVL